MLTSNSNNKKNRILRKISHQPIDMIKNHGKIIYENMLLYNFSSNDYLGLSKNEKLIRGSIEWVKKFGTSLSSSRLISGNADFIEEIEDKIKINYSSKSCIIFGSGYQLNTTAIPAILGNPSKNSNDWAIFCDKFNHSSIYVGSQISGQKIIRYNHLDMDHLEKFLNKEKRLKKIIISESVFSMDGDVVDIKSLRYLAKKYNCILYVDEAHATGIFGTHGYGITEQRNDKNENEITVGTFSKAFGSYGSYMCCSKKIKKNIINYCSGFVYTTSLPPNVLGSINAAVDEMPKLSKKRKQLIEDSNYLRKYINEIGFNTLNSKTNIIPIKKDIKTNYVKIRNYLLKKGFFTSVIRPPTVPYGMDRIRVSVTSHLNKKILNKFISCLKSFEKK